MQTITTFFFCWFLSAASLAQSTTRSISGTVKDKKNEEVPGATVQLLNPGDSAIIESKVTGTSGKFRFGALQNGTFRVSVTAVGHKRFTSMELTIDDLHTSIALPVIILLPAKDNQLAEVVIVAKRPLIEQEIDKTVVNVASMISSATSNALEVLEKTPGVTVSTTGDISLNGRGGITVLIDGRSTYMSGQDLAAYLKSLPGSLLDKIELMDNPPARYDAAGNAIINIRLKKNKAGGFTGNISSGYSQGIYARFNDALNLNYNRKKVNVFGNIGYNQETNYTDDYYNRSFYNTAGYTTSIVSLSNKQQYTSKGSNINVGLDYLLSANTTIGFQLNLNKNSRRGQLEYNSNNYKANNQLENTATGDINGGDRRANVGSNINFQHKFTKRSAELTADLNYLHYRNDGNQHLGNFLYQPDGVLHSEDHFAYLLPSAAQIYTLKADYVQTLKGKAKVETGFKSSVVDNNHVTNFYNVLGVSRTIDIQKSNDFRYRENINAAYLNVQQSWKRLGAQSGIRIENTAAVGFQPGNAFVHEDRFRKNYTQFFPSVFISYKLDTLKKNTLSFSITRRIGRPNYQMLNPFLFFRDKYSYSSGNPLLDPQYQQRFELRLQHKQFLRVALSYNRFTDVILQTTGAVDNILITKPDNIAMGYMVLLNTGLSLSPAKWWNLNADILLSRIGLNGKSHAENLSPDIFVARINMINRVSINKTVSIEFGGYYASRDFDRQAITLGMYRVNAGLQKKIWKDKGSIRLSAEDIFHSWVYRNKSVSLKQAQYYQTYLSDTQRIGLAFTYRFGSDTFARKRKHNDNASDEEKGRVE